MLLVVAWVVAGVYIDRQTEKELAALKAEGYSLSFEELITSSVPDDENGAVEYRRAFALLSPATEEESAAEARIDADPLKWSEEDARLLQGYVARNDEAVSCLEKAAAQPHCQFSFDHNQYSEQFLPVMNQMRGLSRLLTYRLGLALRVGDGRRAIEDALLIWQMAGAFKEQPTLMTSVLSQAFSGISFRAMLRIVSAGVADELTRSDLQILAKQELPKPAVAFSGELSWGLLNFSVLPHYPQRRFDRLAYVRLMRRSIVLSGLPWPYISKEIVDLETDTSKSWLTLTPLTSNMLVPIMVSSLKKREITEAHIRLTWAGVAVEVYRNEHGAYPALLDDVAELVGAENLQDPFGAVLSESASGYTQAPLIYRRRGDSYVLYSVGPNMIDDGGKEPLKSDRTPDWDQSDIVWRGAAGK